MEMQKKVCNLFAQLFCLLWFADFIPLAPTFFFDNFFLAFKCLIKNKSK